MFPFSKMVKIFLVPCLAIFLTISPVALAGETGVVEDKDTTEDRGPGNLDVPEEPTPPAKAPEPEEKEKPEEEPEQDS